MVDRRRVAQAKAILVEDAVDNAEWEWSAVTRDELAAALRTFRAPIVDGDEWRPLADHVLGLMCMAVESAVGRAAIVHRHTPAHSWHVVGPTGRALCGVHSVPAGEWRILSDLTQPRGRRCLDPACAQARWRATGDRSREL